MFTDVANFTHFMSVDEKKSLDFLEQKKTTLSNLVQSLGGEYVKDIGDGALTYFSSVDNALKCAIELQHSLIKISKMEIRIGIHYGEIISVNNDIYGILSLLSKLK